MSTLADCRVVVDLRECSRHFGLVKVNSSWNRLDTITRYPVLEGDRTRWDWRELTGLVVGGDGDFGRDFPKFVFSSKKFLGSSRLILVYFRRYYFTNILDIPSPQIYLHCELRCQKGTTSLRLSFYKNQNTINVNHHKVIEIKHS